MERVPLQLQRFERASFIEMNERIKLLGQARLEIVAPALGFRAIDHADRSLEPPLPEQIGAIVDLRGSGADRLRTRRKQPAFGG